LSELSPFQTLGDLLLDFLREKKENGPGILDISHTALVIHIRALYLEGLEDTPRETPEGLLIIAKVL
jgi:hypothetical protein